MSSYCPKWNLVRTTFIVFGITFLYLRQCSSQIYSQEYPEFPEYNGTGAVENDLDEVEDTSQLYRHYVGCFSRKTLDQITKQMSPKVIVYKPLLIKEECRTACQQYFVGFQSSQLDLIAIQNNICICIPVHSLRDRIPLPLYKISDSYCNFKSATEKNFNIGGSYSMALYTKDKSYYISYFLIDSDLFKIVNESFDLPGKNSSLHFKKEDNDEVSGLLKPCEREECVLRINKDGEICNHTLDNFLRSPPALLTFLNGYTPHSMQNPTLCAGYCATSHKNSISDVLSPSTYSIQSTIYLDLPQYAPIELCTCTNYLQGFSMLGLEKCVYCPTSLTEKQNVCSSPKFQHQIYWNDERQRQFITLPALRPNNTNNIPENPIRPQNHQIHPQNPQIRPQNPQIHPQNPQIRPQNPQINPQIPQTETLVTQAETLRDPVKNYFGNLENCSADKRCKAVDSYGTKWEGCPEEIVRGDCPNSSIPGGEAYWKCNSTGIFFGAQPDYTNCSSLILKEIENKTRFGPYGPMQSIEVLLELRNVVSQPQIGASDSKGTKYFGHDIAKIQDIVKTAVSSQAVNFDEREAIAAEAIGVLGNLIATSTPWGQLNSRSRLSTATNLIVSVEETLFLFANASKTETIDKAKDGFYRKTVNPIVKDPNGFVVTLGAKQKDVNQDIKFPVGSDSFIRIPENRLLKEETVTFVGVIMEPKYVNQLTPPTFQDLNDEQVSTKAFNGKIISLTIEDKRIEGKATMKGVHVKFVHENTAVGATRRDFRRKLHPGEQGKYALGATKCAYWDTTSLVWSTNGCKKIQDKSNSLETICECNHLTAFAILTDVHGYIGTDKGLEILTLILCPLSIICLIATIIILTRMRVLHGERTTITKHLCFNLIIGNLLMLLLVDRNYFFLPSVFCTIVGVVTHYVYLTAFSWMAVQGFYLYRMVVLVFDQGKNYMPMYTIGAYCFPLLPVALTVAIGYGVGDQPYGGEMFCWLNNDYIWAFMGPVAVILLGNFIIMGLTVRTVKKQQNSKFRTHSQISSNRKFLQGCFTISVLLGLTWITAFFTLLDEPSFHFMSYVFTVFNASQGVFILIFYCLLHEKVKPMVLDKMGKAGNLFLQKKDSNLSTSFSKQTSSSKIRDTTSKSEEAQNQSQSDALFEEDETADSNENDRERFHDDYEYEDYDESPPHEIPFPRRVLSTVLEGKSESEEEESEDGLLGDNKQPYPKPRTKPIRQSRIQEESGSESDIDNVDECQQRSAEKPERRYRGPPYMDELLESELYLHFRKSVSDRDSGPSGDD